MLNPKGKFHHITELVIPEAQIEYSIDLMGLKRSNNQIGEETVIASEVKSSFGKCSL